MRRDVFQAIADPIRREIITLVAKHPMTPNGVAESFDVSRQAVSKHMKILLECGLLAYTKQGREYHYSIQPAKLEEVNKWLEPLRELWENRFSQLDDILKQSKRNKNGN